MNQPLISVILPIYNVERYLERCLKAVAEQDYQNLEVLMIDDGSTDSSAKIANRFVEADSRFRLIHQENGGLSNARNHGLDLASGEYVTFIDSDDYVTSDYVSFMYNLLKETDFQAPMALCSLMDVFTDTGRKKDCGDGSRQVLTGKQCIEKMCYHDLVDTCAYAKLCRREMYDKVRFPEGKLFEDIGSTYQLFLQADQVACGFSPKYYYMVRSNSIVTGSFTPAKMDLLEMTDQMAAVVTKVYPDLRAATLRRQVYARFSTLNQTLDAEGVEKEQAQLLAYLRKHKKEVLSDPKTPRRDRLAFGMLSLGFPFYKFAWKTYVKRKGSK